MDWKKVLNKFLEGMFQGGAASLGVTTASGGQPTDPNAMAAAAGTALAVGLLRGIANWWKHRGRG